MTNANDPLVSVVIATYNRSNVLRHAIRSVFNSTLSEWELIVVGDHCTDDTEAVVGEFDDPRVRFVNLAENSGEQAVPNNTGIAMANGRYIAFLNHDDLFFPDHLATSIDWLETKKADLVWGPYAIAMPESTARVEQGNRRFEIAGVPRTDGYDPLTFVLASAWVMRRDLAERVGP